MGDRNLWRSRAGERIDLRRAPAQAVHGDGKAPIHEQQYPQPGRGCARNPVDRPGRRKVHQPPTRHRHTRGHACDQGSETENDPGRIARKRFRQQSQQRLHHRCLGHRRTAATRGGDRQRIRRTVCRLQPAGKGSAARQRRAADQSEVRAAARIRRRRSRQSARSLPKTARAASRPDRRRQGCGHSHRAELALLAQGEGNRADRIDRGTAAWRRAGIPVST